MVEKRCGDNPDSDQAGPVQQWREASYQPCIFEYRAPVLACGPMQTIVYRYYRTQQVPAWISTCMDTVRAWAEQQGFDYRFHDDAFHGYAPPWFRDKAQVGKLDVGTKFLTELRAVMPYPLLENVGMLSPRMLYEITGGEVLLSSLGGAVNGLRPVGSGAGV